MPSLVGFMGNNSIPASPVRRIDFNGDGRGDLIHQFFLYNPVFGTLVMQTGRLISQGSTYVASNVVSGPAFNSVLPVSWNNDGCTDLIVGVVVQISGCVASYASTVSLGNAILATDWDGDGRTDLLADSSGTLQLYRSTGDGTAAPVSTGLATGTGNWIALDQNGDGLDDLAFANSSTSYVVTYGLHRGAGTMPDLAASVTDGFGMAFNPSYVSIVQGTTRNCPMRHFPKSTTAVRFTS